MTVDFETIESTHFVVVVPKNRRDSGRLVLIDRAVGKRVGWVVYNLNYNHIAINITSPLLYSLSLSTLYELHSLLTRVLLKLKGVDTVEG